MNVQEELRNLEELRDSGAITEVEFEQRKARLFNPPPIGMAAPAGVGTGVYSRTDQETRQWAMFLHLSQFAGYFVPIAGLIAPILIWQLKKNELPGLDVHGRNVANWILSSLIYLVISIVLVIVLIGIPLLIALGLMLIIFPIIGGVKANNGEVWKYPLSIEFFK
jgi:Uncharacterized protein conserved in bacteria